MTILRRRYYPVSNISSFCQYFSYFFPVLEWKAITRSKCEKKLRVNMLSNFKFYLTPRNSICRILTKELMKYLLEFFKLKWFLVAYFLHLLTFVLEEEIPQGGGGMWEVGWVCKEWVGPLCDAMGVADICSQGTHSQQQLFSDFWIPEIRFFSWRNGSTNPVLTSLK